MKTPVEDFINSIYAVTIPMLLLVVAFMLKATSLFYSVIEIQHNSIRLVASIFLGIAVSLTLLTVSVNSNLLAQNKWQIVFAICSFIMLLFVFKVISSKHLDHSQYALRIFLSLLLSIIEYLYSHLFVIKYNDHQNQSEEVLRQEKLSLDYQKLTVDHEKLTVDHESISKDYAKLLIYKEALKCKKCGEQHITVSKFKTCEHEPLK